MLGKVVLFVATFGTVLLLCADIVGKIGSCALLSLLAAEAVTMFVWDFKPRLRGPDCGRRMRKKMIPKQDGPASQQEMVLLCKNCRTIVTLGVSVG